MNQPSPCFRYPPGHPHYRAPAPAAPALPVQQAATSNVTTATDDINDEEENEEDEEDPVLASYTKGEYESIIEEEDEEYEEEQEDSEMMEEEAQNTAVYYHPSCEEGADFDENLDSDQDVQMAEAEASSVTYSESPELEDVEPYRSGAPSPSFSVMEVIEDSVNEEEGEESEESEDDSAMVSVREVYEEDDSSEESECSEDDEWSSPPPPYPSHEGSAARGDDSMLLLPPAYTMDEDIASDDSLTAQPSYSPAMSPLSPRTFTRTGSESERPEELSELRLPEPAMALDMPTDVPQTSKVTRMMALPPDPHFQSPMPNMGHSKAMMARFGPRASNTTFQSPTLHHKLHEKYLVAPSREGGSQYEKLRAKLRYQGEELDSGEEADVESVWDSENEEEDWVEEDSSSDGGAPLTPTMNEDESEAYASG
ncbi:hypothetical protein BKA65DRAFT_485819 [Rhexocercosporidium sp. MPI-PUGE-AT-0058]|nr:hypothetical protein BKA65DRAFT_485819 [Rhexocercosporidium sp. MPI-PUGE-AT-0058]